MQNLAGISFPVATENGLGKIDYATVKSDFERMVREAAANIEIIPVDELPSPSVQTTGKIYIAPSENENVSNLWVTEYANSAYAWKLVGTTEVDPHVYEGEFYYE